ncbi:hypothetical protein ACS0TY_034846 [Phlomoides rotata]
MTNLPLLPPPLALENGVPTLQTETSLIHDDLLCIEECRVFEDVSLHNNSEEAEESKKRLSNCEEEKKKKKKKRFKANIPLWGLTSICGRRKEMEDTVVALPSFLRIPSSMLPIFSSKTQDLIAHVFAVFDGHGGSEVSKYCRDRMHLVLAEEISIAKEIRGDSNWEWEQQWLNIFLKCFHKLDDEVGGFSIASQTAPESVGSTAVVAIVCSTHIIVANCGDSRAVLCRGKVSMPLSVDHKPNSEEECTRIEAAGGRVIYWDGYRVSGFLAVSRSIGDRYLRPYVVADPEVMFVARAKDDECLILASDGLWDVMTNEEACDLARRRIVLWHKKNGPIASKEMGNEIDAAAQDAADYLLHLAFQRGSRDNISVMVIDLKAQRKYKMIL